MARHLAFFLGGHDLEMLTIRDLLHEVQAGPVHDRGLAWGAKTSAYRDEIAGDLARGLTPVLIELEDDLVLDPARVIVVDHHGARAGADRPTSLHQVFALLGLPCGRWTRWYDLVAANDRGYIPEMVALGASAEDVARVREADRRAQGVTAEEEAAAVQAAAAIESSCAGRLTVARLPHDRTSPLVDRLHPALGGPGFDNLLVICPGEVAFFGDGSLVSLLDRRYPGGWTGGALPARGFWGRAHSRGLAEQVLEALALRLGSEVEKQKPGLPRRAAAR